MRKFQIFTTNYSKIILIMGGPGGGCSPGTGGVGGCWGGRKLKALKTQFNLQSKILTKWMKSSLIEGIII